MAGWDEFDRQPGERSAAELKRVVRYQQWVIGLVLAQLALWAWCGEHGFDLRAVVRRVEQPAAVGEQLVKVTSS